MTLYINTLMSILIHVILRSVECTRTRYMYIVHDSETYDIQYIKVLFYNQVILRSIKINFLKD